MPRIYGRKTTVDGIVFDSEIEAKYYEHLKEKNIKDLRIHESYVLLEQFRDPQGKIHKQISYSPDFIYYDEDDEIYHFIDVKGWVDDVTKLKWKLFIKHVMGLNIEKYKDAKFSIIKYSKTTGFVDIDQYKKAMASAKKKLKDQKNEAVKAKQQMEKDLITIKKLRSKEKPRTKLQEEKLQELLEKYKDYI